MKEETMSGKQWVFWVVLAIGVAAAASARATERHSRHGTSISTEHDGRSTTAGRCA
jgi:hypothetical protein